MRVTLPVVFTPDKLISENLPEFYPTWSSINHYVTNDIVVYLQSLYQANSNNHGVAPDTNSLVWTRIAPSNSYAMFDDQINTTSKGTGSIVFEVKTGFIDTFAILNIKNANKVKITVREVQGGPIVYQNEVGLNSETILNWFDYFFTSFDYFKTTAIFTDIPPLFGQSTTTVEVTGTGTVEVGQVVFGSTKQVGMVQAGASAGIINYSGTNVNEFGERVFVRRNFSKRLDTTLFIDNMELNRIYRLLSDLRDTPALWIASDDLRFEEPLIVFGFNKNFNIEIPYPNHSFCSLEVEGLI